MSPTPYWSSSSMNMPDRKSRTRFCAPNPTAMPSTPAEASIGASATPNSASTITNATSRTTAETIERSTEPIVWARCARRWVISGLAAVRSRFGARPSSFVNDPVGGAARPAG